MRPLDAMCGMIILSSMAGGKFSTSMSGRKRTTQRHDKEVRASRKQQRQAKRRGR